MDLMKWLDDHADSVWLALLGITLYILLSKDVTNGRFNRKFALVMMILGVVGINPIITSGQPDQGAVVVVHLISLVITGLVYWEFRDWSLARARLLIPHVIWIAWIASYQTYQWFAT
jgi:tryptophan-rich sensory protein